MNFDHCFGGALEDVFDLMANRCCRRGLRHGALKHILGSIPSRPGRLLLCEERTERLNRKSARMRLYEDIPRRELLACVTGCATRLRRVALFCGLKSESRLITHRDAIEHVARRGCGSVSLGAFTKTAKRLGPENLRGDRRCRRQFSFRIRRRR